MKFVRYLMDWLCPVAASDTDIVETSVPVPWIYNLSFSSINIFKHISKGIE
jgi:hypothetical protein